MLTRWRLRSPLYKRPPPRKRARPAVEVPGTGVTDLERFIVGQLAALHPALRSRAEWVMNPWWEGYVRKLAAPPAGLPEGTLETLLGLPLAIARDGGWPHLAQRPDRDT